MTQEEKQLLLKDLCARLPYGVKADFKQGQLTRVKHEVEGWYIDEIKDDNVVFIKPYLRPMSSMTKEEEKEYDKTPMRYLGDFYCSRHFDHHNLIEKGLALEAPEGMYKTE